MGEKLPQTIEGSATARSAGGPRTVSSPATAGRRSTPALGPTGRGPWRLLHDGVAANCRGWRWVYDGGGPQAARSTERRARKCIADPAGKGAGSADHPAAAADCRAGAEARPTDNGRGQSADKTLGGTGRSRRAARASSASISGRAVVTRRCSTTTCRRRRPNDRAVRLGAGHLPGDHRSAGLRADLRQPDSRRRRPRIAARWRSDRR